MKCMFVLVVAAALLAPRGDMSAAVIYHDNFDGDAAAPLHGTTPDVGNNTWRAYQDTAMAAGGGFKANGAFDAASTAKGAFLPFTPESGKVYTLEASLNVQTTGGNTWAAFGFAGGIPADPEAGNNRFVEGAGLGRAWTLVRTLATTNQTFVGGGTANGENWVAGPSNGGDFDLRIVLDTRSPIYTATFYAKRPADTGYTQVSSGARNVDPATSPIGAIGFADNFGAFQARVSRLDLSVVPEPGTAALMSVVGTLATMVWRGRRLAG
jgi:hypothetical protein